MSSNAIMMLSGLIWYKTTSKQVKTIIKKLKIKQNKTKNRRKIESERSFNDIIPFSGPHINSLNELVAVETAASSFWAKTELT